jgi:hypothetical protein
MVTDGVARLPGKRSETVKRRRTFKQIQRLRRYLKVLALITRDSVWRFKMRAFVALVAGMLALSGQLGALGVALRYAHLLERGATLRLLGRSFEARSSFQLLVLFGVGVAGLLLISGLLMYYSRTRILKLRRAYELFCSSRVLELLGTSARIWAPPNRPFSDDRSIIQIARRDARYCGRVLVMLLDSVVPFVAFLAMSGVMLSLRPGLTLGLFALIGLSSIFFIRVNAGAARNSRIVEETMPAVQRQYRQTVQWLRGGAFPAPSEWIDSTLLQNREVKKHFDAYEARLRATEDSRVISNVVLALAFFVIMMSFGGSIIGRGSGWGELVGYLIALRYGMIRFRAVTHGIAGINRFYPQWERYFAFVKASSTSPRVEADDPSGLTIYLEDPPLKGSLHQFGPLVGSTIGLSVPFAVTRYSLAFVLDSLFKESPNGAEHVLGNSVIASPDYGCLPDRPFRDSVGLPRSLGREDVIQELKELRAWDRVAADFPETMEGKTSTEEWKRLSDELKFLLAVLAVQRSDAAWVILDERGLMSLSEETCAAVLERLSERVLLIPYARKASKRGSYREDTVAALDADGNLLGVGPVAWFVEVEPQVAALSGAAEQGTSPTSSYLDEEEEEEDDDDL